MSAQTAAPETLAGLTVLARALCGDGRITVVSDGHSVFNATSHVIGIHVDPASEPERAQGLLAHECGHALITRYHLWDVPASCPSAWFELLNAVEDPRVDGWMVRRYAGSLAWFEILEGDVEGLDLPPPRSLFLQFCAAAAAVDRRGRCLLGPESWPHPLAVGAFDATIEARRRYCDTVPEPGLSPPSLDCEAGSSWREDLRAGSVSAPCIDAIEAGVRRSAHAAWRIARDEILPVVQPLIDRDVARIVALARRDAAVDHALTQGNNQARVEAVRIALELVSPDSADVLAVASDDDDRRKSALRAFDDFIADRRRSTAASQRGKVGYRPPWEPGDSDEGDDDVEIGGPGVIPPSTNLSADEIARRIRAQIAALRATLERIMVDRRRLRRHSGFRSGDGPDLRRLMRFDADRRDDRIWKRSRRDLTRDGRIGLLVDLSGSMSGGGKIEAAVAGTMLFAEAASGAGIDFLIDGFQNVLIPIVSVGERCTPVVRRRIEEMALEVENCRPGGNNASGNNDDGPCLDAFADKLLAGPGRRRLLIVISDGAPAGLRSTADDLRRSVARLSARSDLTLVGIGLGAGTSHVRDFYPIALAEVPVERLGAEISRVLETYCRRW